MIIGFEAKRIYHNRSGLGNFGRNLVTSMALYHPENSYLLFNSHPGRIEFGRDLQSVKEVLPWSTAPLYRDLWRQSLLTRDLLKFKVEIFHGLSMELPKGIKKRGIPAILSVHDLIFLRYPHLYKIIDRKIYEAKLRRSVNEAQLIVATSEQTKRDLVELLNVDPAQVKVHYQGVHPVYWQKALPEEVENTKSELGLPARYALFVGTREERKGVQSLLDAQLETGISIVYVGRSTAFWNKITADKKYDPIRDKIFTPEIHDTLKLSHVYQGAVFFVYPSIFEGFGIPVLEALVSGIPVITSNRSSLPEVAGPGSVLTNPDSTPMLAEAMQKMWNSMEMRRVCVENSLTFIEQFRDKRLAEQWQNTYLSVLS